MAMEVRAKLSGNTTVKNNAKWWTNSAVMEPVRAIPCIRIELTCKGWILYSFLSQMLISWSVSNMVKSMWPPEYRRWCIHCRSDRFTFMYIKHFVGGKGPTQEYQYPIPTLVSIVELKSFEHKKAQKSCNESWRFKRVCNDEEKKEELHSFSFTWTK